jgi:hypothetical protein
MLEIYTFPQLEEGVEMVSGQTIQALMQMTLNQSTLQIWVFITEITDKFILGLDILQDYNTLVDLWCHVL